MEDDLEAIVLPFRKTFLPDNAELDAMLIKTAQDGGSTEQIIRRLVGSAAFRRTYPRIFDGISLGYQPKPIDLDLDDDLLAELLRRTRSHWETLGRTRPFWSVVSTPAFSKDDGRTAEKRAAFYNSGRVEVRDLMQVLERTGASIPFASAIEFGCGLGRMTEPLAERFGKVLAVDVSKPHIEVAAAHCADRGKTDVTFHHLEDLADPLPGGHDFALTYHVLQHNPPPVMQIMIRRLFSSVARGGIAMIHVPVHIENYRFDIDAYLGHQMDDGTIEMHAFPQARLLDIAREHGFRLIDVIDVAGRMRHRMISQLMTFQRSEDSAPPLQEPPTGRTDVR